MEITLWMERSASTKKNQSSMTLVSSLKNPTEKRLSSFNRGVEEDYAGFLGIEIKRYPDGTIELIKPE